MKNGRFERPFFMGGIKKRPRKRPFLCISVSVFLDFRLVLQLTAEGGSSACPLREARKRRYMAFSSSEIASSGSLTPFRRITT